MKAPPPFDQRRRLRCDSRPEGLLLPRLPWRSSGAQRVWNPPAAQWRSLAPVLLVAVLVVAGCATRATTEVERTPRLARPGQAQVDVDVLQRAETRRANRLAAQVEHLQADLKQAEEALVTAESGLRGSHSRADAVSNLAEARILVDRAAAAAPWRAKSIERARAKLAEADRQIQQQHFGAALFFIYRAQRLATSVELEARKVYSEPGTRFIRGRRVNLRAGPSTSEPVLFVLSEGTPVFPEDHSQMWVLVRTPSGSLGWVHKRLLVTAGQH